MLFHDQCTRMTEVAYKWLANVIVNKEPMSERAASVMIL